MTSQRVDVVFMGHDHDYERTLPLYADEVVEPGDGTVYITTGGGGADLGSVAPSRFTAFAEKAFHAMRVTVNGDTLQADMVRADGVVRDTVLLTKGTAACLPAGCCNSHAECDDQQPCTVDSCRPSGVCRHPTIDLDSVRAAVADGEEAEECDGEVIPRRVSLPIERGRDLLERAARAPRTGRAVQLVRKAARKLLRAGRRAERASERGRISPACAAALASIFTDAHFECVSR